MKTLQECKDEAAKNWNEAFDFTALFNGVSVGNIKMIHLRGVIDEAAELYARAKWDEACDAQKLSCMGAAYSRQLINKINNASKPEFKK